MATHEEVRRQMREHLAKLDPIRSELNRYLNVEPLSSDTVPTPVPVKEWSAANDRMKEWQAEWQRLRDEFDRSV